MSTLLTTMETITETKPWLDRPRNAAKVMAGVSTLLGIVAAIPSIYVVILLFPLVGYALCVGYWKIALGTSGNPAFWWKTSLVYNGVLVIATIVVICSTIAELSPDTIFYPFALLAWQLIAFHLSRCGLHADAVASEARPLSSRPWIQPTDSSHRSSSPVK